MMLKILGEIKLRSLNHLIKRSDESTLTVLPQKSTLTGTPKTTIGSLELWRSLVSLIAGEK